MHRCSTQRFSDSARDLPFAKPPLSGVQLECETCGAVLNGNIAATVGSDGLVSVSRVSDGVLVLQELAREVVRQ